MDDFIIDEYEIETETENLYSDDIIDTGIEVLNIEAADFVDDLVFDLVYQTESIEAETVSENELISSEPETVSGTELIIQEPETVPDTELISAETEIVSETELTSADPETEILEVQTETVASDPETELLEVQTETVVADPETELLEIQTETVSTDPETEILEVQTENLDNDPDTESIVIENIATEHLESLGVLHETDQNIKVDEIVSDQQVIQEEVLSDNKEIEQLDPEEESEFSFVELVKDNSKKDEILNDGSNNDNTLYDIDDIYNLISLRIPENSRLFTSKYNLDDIYNLLSDNMSPDLLSPTYVRTLNDDVEIVEVEEDLKKGETDEAVESETTSLSDIYDLIDEQNKILRSNQEIELAILQNQKTMSDNDNKMNTFLVSGVFAVLGAIVISNLFRGIR